MYELDPEVVSELYALAYADCFSGKSALECLDRYHFALQKYIEILVDGLEFHLYERKWYALNDGNIKEITLYDVIDRLSEHMANDRNTTEIYADDNVGVIGVPVKRAEVHSVLNAIHGIAPKARPDHVWCSDDPIVFNGKIAL